MSRRGSHDPRGGISRTTRTCRRPAPVPAEFEKKLWNDLRGTLRDPATANAEKARRGVKPPAIIPEIERTPEDASDVVEVDFVLPQQRRRVEPRVIRAASAIVVALGLVVAGLALIDLNDRNDVATDDNTAPGPTVATPSTAFEPPLLLTDPRAACARYTETVGDSAREIKDLLGAGPPDWQESVAERVATAEGAIDLLARDLAASPALYYAAIESRLELTRGTLGQLRLEVLAGKQTAAVRTIENAFVSLGDVANLVPDGACDNLRLGF